jgi:membrane-associated protease RseP (regulator of RpoE activity)
MDFNTFSIIAFYSILAIFIYKNRSKIQRHAGIIFIYETTRGIKLMDRLAKYERFWKVWSYAGIPVGYLGMGFIFYFLFNAFIFPTPEATISPIIPGVKIPGSNFFLPFWHGIIALFSLLVIHEGAHGIISRVHKVKVESTGVGLLAILPFAFVKPNEKQIKKLSASKRIAMYAAGPFANITTALLAFGLLIFGVMPLLTSSYDLTGLNVINVTENFPAYSAGLEKEDIITFIDGVPISESSTAYDILLSKKPGDELRLTLDSGEIVTMDAVINPDDPNDGHYGFSFEGVAEQKENAWYAGSLLIFKDFLYFFITLSLGVGLFNLLPLGPLDGGKMIKDGMVALTKREKASNRVFIYLSLLTFLMLLVSIFRPMIA